MHDNVAYGINFSLERIQSFYTITIVLVAAIVLK